ncbi:MAG: ABC transporter substrate-binding protein [Coriobacteriia bacterium]|nr:ABC transporter substrate-binding protein [Coriobacteriia bacterium]
MKRVLSLIVALMLATSLSLAGCAAEEPVSESEPAAASATVIDLAGREVIVPENVERVVAIGPGALRLVVYAGGAKMVAGIEDIENKPPISRPYILAHPELLELPVIGAGGPDTAPDAERLIGVAPDVIFVGQLADAAAADELQAATGIPVVVLSYGGLGNFDDAVVTSLNVVGTMIGTIERTDEVSAYITDTLADLSARTAGIDDGEKPTAFVGALGFKGMHGLESTQGKYPPFVAIGAKNVAGDLGTPGSVMIDKEKLLEWDPEYLFVDCSGLGLVAEDVAANRALYEGLSAVNDGCVYTQLPFNNYWTNIEVALADAYYAGSVMFPDRFADVDAVAKADEISTFLAGASVYERLTEIYGCGFGAIDLLGNE